jgi:type II secretion system protein C
VPPVALRGALRAARRDVPAGGIVLSPRSERSVVLLSSGGRTRAASPGETVFGVKVDFIASDRVVVVDGDERRELRLAAGKPMGGAPALGGARSLPTLGGVPLTAVPDPASGSAPVRTMERGDVQRRLTAEIPRILSETTILPVFENGAMSGFTITRMPEGGLLSDAGLRAGDVLTRVNDTPIDSLATLIGLWPKLQNEPSLRALVLRNGQPVTLNVNLK